MAAADITTWYNYERLNSAVVSHVIAVDEIELHTLVTRRVRVAPLARPARRTAIQSSRCDPSLHTSYSGQSRRDLRVAQATPDRARQLRVLRLVCPGMNERHHVTRDRSEQRRPASTGRS